MPGPVFLMAICATDGSRCHVESSAGAGIRMVTRMLTCACKLTASVTRSTRRRDLTIAVYTIVAMKYSLSDIVAFLSP